MAATKKTNTKAKKQRKLQWLIENYKELLRPREAQLQFIPIPLVERVLSFREERFVK